MTVFELTFTFFQTYLLKEKGLSDNTVASYAESVKQLLNFAAKKDNIQLHKLDLASFRAGLVRSFLDQIDKKNSIATRNLRLSAIRTFFKYLGKQHPSMLAAAEDICALANKKTSETIIDHLKENEVHAFIDLARQQPNELKRARDTAVFLLMHNTGARASEIVHLTIEDFEMSPLPIITLTGKGRKKRQIPLWSETAEAINYYINRREKLTIKTRALFLNPQKQRLSRFGLRHIIRQYKDRLSSNHPTLRNKSVSPHTFRHTTAFHLLRAGQNLVTVKDWLGHADINTTSKYCTIDPETKRKALETFRTKDQPIPPCKWKNPDVYEFLNKLAKSA